MIYEPSRTVNAQRMRTLRANRRQAGECPRCGLTAEDAPKRRLCRSCRVIMAALQREETRKNHRPAEL